MPKETLWPGEMIAFHDTLDAVSVFPEVLVSADQAFVTFGLESKFSVTLQPLIVEPLSFVTVTFVT